MEVQGVHWDAPARLNWGRAHAPLHVLEPSVPEKVLAAHCSQLAMEVAPAASPRVPLEHRVGVVTPVGQ